MHHLKENQSFRFLNFSAKFWNFDVIGAYIGCDIGNFLGNCYKNINSINEVWGMRM